jgi:hypothetical protein
MKTQYDILKYEGTMTCWLRENMTNFKVIRSGETFTASCKNAVGKFFSAKASRQILAIYDLYQVVRSENV